MKIRFLLICVLTGGLLSIIYATAPVDANSVPSTTIHATGDAEPHEELKELKAAYFNLPDSTSVLDDAIKINDAAAPAPPKSFRSGHVEFTSLDPVVTSNANGFEIKMPNSTQVPTPTFHNGKLYVSGGFGSKEFYCLDAFTGAKVWSVTLDDDGPSPAVIQDGIVVFNTESCTIFACDAETGQMKWSWWLGDPLMSMPTVIDGKVFTAYPAPYGYSSENRLNNIEAPANENNAGSAVKINAPDAKPAEIHSRLVPTHVLAAFDLQTGKILWQKWIDGDVMSAPVGVGSELLVTTFPGTVYRFNQTDGNILAANSTRATSAPVVVNGRILMSRRADADGNEPVSEEIAGFENGLASPLKFNKKEAQYLNKNVQANSALKSTSMNLDAGNGFTGGAPSTAGGTKAADNIGVDNVSSLQSFQGSRVLYYKGRTYTTMGDELVANDGGTGDKLWRQSLEGDLNQSGGFLGAPPLVAGGKIVLATLSGEIRLMDPETGALLRTIKVEDQLRQQPIVEAGWIYISTVSGKVLAINSGDPTLTGWPVWGRDNAHTGVPVE